MKCYERKRKSGKGGALTQTLTNISGKREILGGSGLAWIALSLFLSCKLNVECEEQVRD